MVPSALLCHRQAFEQALPRIEQHLVIYFRHVRCPHTKADFIAEGIGLCWRWWLRLTQVGKDPTQFVSTIATYAGRASRSGRRVCGQEKAADTLSSVSQQRHGYTVGALPADRGQTGNVFAEALRDNTQTLPAEQVAFRLDFAAWLLTQADRHRRIIFDLMVGERTLAVSQKHGTTPGRISQLRREYQRDWQLFCGEAS